MLVRPVLLNHAGLCPPSSREAQLAQRRRLCFCAQGYVSAGAAVWERMDGGGLTFGLVSGMEGQRWSLNHMAVHLSCQTRPLSDSLLQVSHPGLCLCGSLRQIDSPTDFKAASSIRLHFNEQCVVIFHRLIVTNTFLF